MKIEWYCGNYVGPAYWRMSGDWVKEPDECATVFITEEDEDEWNEEICWVNCPSCGAELHQKWDCPEIVEEEILEE